MARSVSIIHGKFHYMSWPIDAYLFLFKGLLYKNPPSDFPEHWNPMKTEIGKTDIVLEAGANVGGLTRVIATHAKEVHSFEPSPRAFHYLTKHTKMIPNVHRYNMGIEDRKKQELFNLEYSFSGANSVYHVSDGGKWECAYHNQIKANFISIDEFCEEYNIIPTIIILDCEGSEINALKGAKETLPMIKKIFIETHYIQTGSTAPKVKELLQQEGYQVSKGWDRGDVLWLIGHRN